jgi:hypothetical protein
MKSEDITLYKVWSDPLTGEIQSCTLEYYEKMKNIKQKEIEILDEFKTIVVIDNEGTPHPVPVLYAAPNWVQQVIKIEKVDPQLPIEEKVRLPIIGVHTTHVGHNHFIMDGVVKTLYREDMRQILEQFHHTIEPNNDKITISEVAITEGTTRPEGGMPGLSVLTGTFTVEYRE